MQTAIPMVIKEEPVQGKDAEGKEWIYRHFDCPGCGTRLRTCVRSTKVMIVIENALTNLVKPRFCPFCGTPLDWGQQASKH